MLKRIVVLSLFPVSALAAAFEGAPVATAEELDRMRGGFTLQLGRQTVDVAFGIERALFVNGEMISADRLSAPISVLQNGAGNSFAVSPVQPISPAFMNVVQNSLDGQLIRQMTVIGARVRTLEAFAAQRFGAALSQQIQGSVR